MRFDAIPCPAESHVRSLIDASAPSRIAAKDSTVFGLSDEATAHAGSFMAWTTLASQPPFDPAEIADFASRLRAEGLDDIVLIGQGGSSQAPMTMAELLDRDGSLSVGFHTMDSLDAAQIGSVLDMLDPDRTLFIISSKSGSTIEPRAVFSCVWNWLGGQLGDGAGNRFIAITDPGSSLEDLARELGFRAVFSGEPAVGGRFSALSVFGLVPFACMGIDIVTLLDRCAEVERLCSLDDMSNPALRLAGFINEGRAEGRDKISFRFDGGTESLGFWLEQLIAESLGKNGKGILPNTESDGSLLTRPHKDRCAILYTLYSNNTPSTVGNDDVPFASMELSIASPEDVALHFVLWENVVSLLGVELGVNPFDQPDVETTKRNARELLFGGQGAPGPGRAGVVEADGVTIEVSDAVLGGRGLPGSVGEAVEMLLSTIGPGDYFSINAFIPHDESLEQFRREVADVHGCASCLEMGPRYLHSIGQLHKGGPDTGVFLIVSKDQPEDLQVPDQPFSLGELATAEAYGDFKALSANGRRVVHIHYR